MNNVRKAIAAPLAVSMFSGAVISATGPAFANPVQLNPNWKLAFAPNGGELPGAVINAKFGGGYGGGGYGGGYGHRGLAAGVIGAGATGAMVAGAAGAYDRDVGVVRKRVFNTDGDFVGFRRVRVPC